MTEAGIRLSSPKIRIRDEYVKDAARSNDIQSGSSKKKEQILLRLQTLCKIVNDYIHEACRDFTERTSDGTMRMKLRKYKPAQLLSDYQKLCPEDVFQVSNLRNVLRGKRSCGSLDQGVE